MGPVLEEAAILLQQTDKVFPPVGIKPGGEDQGVGPFDGVDRVDLYEPHLPDLVLDGPATARAAWIREHPLGAKKQPTYGGS